MLLNTTIKKSDTVGAVASGLCLVHCIITPFIFIAQTCSVTCCTGTPIWWRAIDYLFLGIAFFAIYWSVQTTTKNWMKYALWGSWIALLFVIVNEKVNLVQLAQQAIYLPALGLVSLHLYNRKYCQCVEEQCCTTV